VQSTHTEAQLCAGDDVAVVGGGNSAGQAAAFLAGRARHVHMVVRAEGLSSTMSRYLVRRIEEHPSITLQARTEVVALCGSGRLDGVVWRGKDGDSNVAARHLFSMTGATPNTAWLDGCVALDSAGFVLTGADLTAQHLADSRWTLRRAPHPLETSLPGVFAVGDVRSGSVKRVASAVGEGSVAIATVHQVLAEL
jgi:thioredoxin reductase (NADPH)